MLLCIRKVALAWACLACAFHGRRLLTTRSGRLVLINNSSRPSMSLEALLQALSPSAAFGAAELRTASSQSLGDHHPIGLPWTPLKKLLWRPLQMSDGEEASEADMMDWRELRARLVAQERAEEQEEDGLEDSTNSGNGYAYESPLIEQGSVVLCGTKRDFGFAIRQQYFHKSVMLVVQHDQFFTKGIILNRPTAHEIDGWRVWCGGDVCEGGMFIHKTSARADRDILCLHKLEGDMKDLKSFPVIKGVAYTDFDNAKDLIGRGVANRSDFWTFVGYAGWAPEQLQGEVDRNTWYLAATDASTLIQEMLELPPPSAGKLPDGCATWETLMQKLGLGEEVERTRNCLADRMLREWCRLRLIPKKEQSTNKSAEIQRPRGTVLRTGVLSDRALLDEQFLHKSLMMVVAEMPQDTLVMVVLNRPFSRMLQFNIGKRERRSISFGGPRRLLGKGLGLDQHGLMWIGQSAKFKSLSMGHEIGKSGLSSIGGEEAAKAIKDGRAEIGDFLVILGLSVFKRDELTSMVQKGELVVIDDPTPMWPQVFKLTDGSNLLSEGGPGLSDGISAWWSAGLLQKKAADAAAGAGLGGQGITFNTELPVMEPTELADKALAEWLKLFAGHADEGEEE